MFSVCFAPIAHLSVPGKGIPHLSMSLRFLISPDPVQVPRTEGVTTVENVKPLEGQTLLGSN